MGLKWFTDFFSPTQTKQGQLQQGQLKQQVPKPPLPQTSGMFAPPKQRQQQQQQRQKQQQQKQQQKFVPAYNLPPMKMTSQALAQQNQQQLQLAKNMLQQVNQQARQSGQQLAQKKQQALPPAQLRQAQNAHAQVLSYAQKARTLLKDIDGILLRIRENQSQTQQSRRHLQKARKDADHVVAGLRTLMEEFTAIRQQNRQVQQRHIRQLQQIKTNLLAQAEGLRPAKVAQQCRTKVIHQDRNKIKIDLNIRPDYGSTLGVVDVVKAF